MPGTNHTRPTRSIAAFTALTLALSTGCAYRRAGLANETERVIRSTRHPAPAPRADISVTQDGTRVTVRAARQCTVNRSELVETTRSYGRESRAPGPFVAAGIIGGLGAGGGSLLAANIFQLPPASRAGPEDYTAEFSITLGVILIGVGTALVSVAAGHGFSLLGTDDEVSRRVVERGPVGPPGPCAPAEPMAEAVVTLEDDEERVELGSLRADGELTLDPSLVIPAAFVMRNLGREVEVKVAGHRAPRGVVMDPFVASLDERVWAAADPGRCAAAEQPNDCSRLRRYLQLFPRGAHSDRAQAILDEATERLAERARVLEEARRAEAERRQVEEEQRRLAEQQRIREEEERWERERRQREAEAEARRRTYEAELEARTRAADEARRRRAARAQCQQACRQSCEGNRQCTAQCVSQRCR